MAHEEVPNQHGDPVRGGVNTGEIEDPLLFRQPFPHQLFGPLSSDQVERDQKHERDADVGHVLQPGNRREYRTVNIESLILNQAAARIVGGINRER